MQHGDVVLGLLVPACENPSEAIHPTMRPFHYPTPCLDAGFTFEFLGFFPADMNMCREGELLNNVTHFVIVVPFIHAHSLRSIRRGRGPLDGDTVERVRDHLHVVAVGAVHGQTHRDACGLDQQAALGALLGAIGRVFACLFPPRGAPWSCTRPCSAKTSRCLSSHRRPASWLPTSSERHQPSPILGSGHGPSTQGRSGWRPGLSTDRRCGAQRESPPYKRDPAFAVYRRRNVACSHVWGSAVRWPATSPQQCPNRQLPATRPCCDLRGVRSCQGITSAAHGIYSQKPVIPIT